MVNLEYKKGYNEGKYFKNMQNNQFLKVKNNLLESEKDFMELKDRELKDTEEKIKGEIEELFRSRLSCLKIIWIIRLKNKKWRK